MFQAFEAEPSRDWAGEYRRSTWYAQYVMAAADGRGAVGGQRQAPPPPPSKNRFAQFSTLCRRYLAVIGSDRVYLGLLAGAPIVLGAVILAIPAQYGLAPAPVPAHHGKQAASPTATPHPTKTHHTGARALHPAARASGHPTAHPSAHATVGHVAHSAAAGVNNSASSLLLILVICACFAGAFNAVRELVKERAIYGRERAAGLSTASYLSSKLTVLGLISGIQAAIMVLIGLATRKLPPSGALLHAFPLAELIIALAVLAVVSMALGLLISASVNTSEKTMPILMVVVVVEVILTGGVFAIAEKAGLEQISWLSPSRWGYALTASTSNLNVIMPPPGSATDPLWAHTPQAWLTNMVALILLGLIFSLLTWWRLVRQSPGRRA